MKTVIKGFKPEALNPAGVQSPNGVKADPFLSDALPFGPIVEITPNVAADGRTIRLDVNATQTEFLGYEKQSKKTKKTRVWVDGKEQNIVLPLPIIHTPLASLTKPAVLDRTHGPSKIRKNCCEKSAVLVNVHANGIAGEFVVKRLVQSARSDEPCTV